MSTHQKGKCGRKADFHFAVTFVVEELGDRWGLYRWDRMGSTWPGTLIDDFASEREAEAKAHELSDEANPPQRLPYQRKGE